MSDAAVICPGNASEAEECVSTSPEPEQGEILIVIQIGG